MKAFNSDALILAVSSSYGVYAPQTFSEWYSDKCVNILEGDLKESFEDLKNINSEFYWESWENVLDNAVISIDGELYNIIQNEDVWLIPVDMEIPEDFFI